MKRGDCRAKTSIVLQTIATTGPRVPLSRFVEGVRVSQPAPGRACRVDRLPDGRTTLVFRLLEGGRRGDVTVLGPRTRALLKDASGFERAVALQLKPGWSTPLLGVPARELTDELVSLDDIWGRSARELCLDWVATPNVGAVLDHFARALSRNTRAGFEPATARLARQAARLLESEETRVGSAATRLGVTARHLRRAFLENIGVGPKDFARSARLQRAVRLLSSSRDWARIASDAGFYDQSHLIAEFRALVGLTPGAFLARASEPSPPLM